MPQVTDRGCTLTTGTINISLKDRYLENTEKCVKKMWKKYLELRTVPGTAVATL